MEIEVEGHSLGRIEFELFKETPRTSCNFYALCTGERGKGLSNKPLHFLDNVFHRIVPNFLI